MSSRPWVDTVVPLSALVTGLAIGVSDSPSVYQAFAGAITGFVFGACALLRAIELHRRETAVRKDTQRLEEMRAVYAMGPVPEGCAVFGIVEPDDSGTWRAVAVEREEGAVVRSSIGGWPTRLAAFESCAILVEDIRRECAQAALSKRPLTPEEHERARDDAEVRPREEVVGPVR